MNKNIQLLRGVAAIFVAIAHFRTVAPYNTNYEFLSMFAFGVDLFFVISGYVMASMVYKYNINNSLYHSCVFFLVRAIRILPAMWVSMLIYLVIIGFYSGEENFIYSIFLLPSANNSYNGFEVFFLEPQWSLGFELIFYIFVSLCILKSFSRYIGISILFLIFLLSYLFDSNYYISPLYYEFFVGFIAFKFKHYFSRFFISSYMLCIGLSLLFIVAGYYYREYAGDIYSIERSIVFGTLAGSLIVALNSLKKKLDVVYSMILLSISKISYSIYLMHMPVLMLFVQLNLNLSYFLALALFLLVVVLTSYIFYLLVEHPSHNFSRYIFKKYVIRGLND